ncbi:DUF1772 domain-containing protein [Herbiconiux sp. VKM Ac-1786]|uniref:anthrone oxygenase family protein n=1 Tax=Herbiconiux sp. VKM Ac-1786 TaxID=2783824 RepID=UPI00188BCB45|nr:anthrone oxygenase family protein [Herbiconiux sp. VKM Ac-1786]MBF4571534.1 DUF1772 domain-containing protein [Herbiconiux sp. VKM Ac-1786]
MDALTPVAIGLTAVSALGAGLVGGVFFAFSAFVMQGLADAPPTAGLAAMQGVNRAAVRPPLMVALFGTLLVGAAAAVLLAVDGAGHAVWWAVGGAVVYLGAVVGVTIGFHVPRNEALARVGVDDPDAPAAWSRYVTEWTRGNHVRAVGGALAAALFGVAAITALL